jgi:hypothetical protein
VEPAKWETTVACWRDIKTKGGQVIWQNKLIASLDGMDPYMLMPQKENRDLMKKFVPFMDSDKKEVEENLTQIQLESGKDVAFKSEVTMGLCDAKAIAEAAGLGGAYCNCCTTSDKDAHDIDKVKEGFECNRHMEDVIKIADTLFDEGIGEIKR